MHDTSYNLWTVQVLARKLTRWTKLCEHTGKQTDDVPFFFAAAVIGLLVTWEQLLKRRVPTWLKQ